MTRSIINSRRCYCHNTVFTLRGEADGRWDYDHGAEGWDVAYCGCVGYSGQMSVTLTVGATRNVVMSGVEKSVVLTVLLTGVVLFLS